MVKSYRVRLMNKRGVAEGAVAYEFAKPKGFNYLPGQFVTLSLADAGTGQTRSFSLASAPYEKRLMAAVWQGTSPFKLCLQKLRPGSEVVIKGPFGKFTLDNETSKPAVFLAGGIGITPVRSIVLQTDHDGLGRELAIFYSSRTPETAPFLAELGRIRKPNYAFIPTMTRLPESRRSWDGERGRINSTMLEKYLPDPTGAIYYLVGSTRFVNAMIKMLKKMDIGPEAMKLEKFGGQ
jgi:ferredoxin-NADP reductase